MSIPSTTIYLVAVWKNEELQRYCVALVTAAVNLLDIGTCYFGSDDILDKDQPTSHAIPGSAISTLRAAHVIEDFFGSVREEKITNGRRMSKRKAANGRKVNLFSLTSRAMAIEFLLRNGVKMEPVQMELGLF
jgi:hypothetical protein